MKGNSKLGKAFNTIISFSETHQREIKLGITITGVVLTGIASARAGIKVNKVIANHKEKMENLEDAYKCMDNFSEDEYKEEKKEIVLGTVKEMIPAVLPPVVIGGVTIWSAVSGYNAASKKIAAITAAYNISEKALTEYTAKAKEMLGEKKAGEIKDEVNADKVKNNPPVPENIIFNTGNGTTLCYDELSGRYFYSSPESLRKAANIINKRMMDEYYISLNEYYDECRLPGIILGEDCGFNIDDGLIDVEHLFSATLYNDQPVLVLNLGDYISAKYSEHRGNMFR